MLRHHWLLYVVKLLRHGKVIEGYSSLGLDLSEGVSIEDIICWGTIVQVADFRGRHRIIICYHISVNIWVFFVYQIQLWALSNLRKLWLLLESSSWFQ